MAVSRQYEECFFEEAILIRCVEEYLLSLFGSGLLSGTVHTCIGQEFSALAFGKQIGPNDFIFSNHRCHGHYVAFVGEYRNLIAEMLGKRSGVSGGIGGTQHLCARNFYSNGIQGGIAPVAAGMALANKLRGNEDIGVVFIGDGTLGEGLVYEVFNLISKWEIPLLVVLENNGYAQSTSQSDTLAGSIIDRPASFGIETFESSTDDVERLFENAKVSIDYVRANKRPAFHLVNTARLAPHSKGDDNRSVGEIENAKARDPLVRFSIEFPDIYQTLVEKHDANLKETYDELAGESSQELECYLKDSEADGTGRSRLAGQKTEWETVEISHRQEHTEYLIQPINRAFHALMERHDDVLFIGEDILSPYGGAFKATVGLSDAYPDRILTSPISEAAIIGISNGLAISGYRPFAEIMFGDFMTLAIDQLVNHATKFHTMYNKQVTCPIVVRTPMGGGRGYGPTHSQTLDKLLLGIDNLLVVALNRFLDPMVFYEQLMHEERPAVVIENKKDYARKAGQLPGGLFTKYTLERSNACYPTLRFSPTAESADVSLVCYGGTVEVTLQAAENLFAEEELICEVIVLSQINPIPVKELCDAITTEQIVIVEEGTPKGGFGSEVIASLVETRQPIQNIERVASLPVAIPSAMDLEKDVLVSAERIVSAAVGMANAGN